MTLSIVTIDTGTGLMLSAQDVNELAILDYCKDADSISCVGVGVSVTDALAAAMVSRYEYLYRQTELRAAKPFINTEHRREHFSLLLYAPSGPSVYAREEEG